MKGKRRKKEMILLFETDKNLDLTRQQRKTLVSYKYVCECFVVFSYLSIDALLFIGTLFSFVIMLNMFVFIFNF